MRLLLREGDNEYSYLLEVDDSDESQSAKSMLDTLEIGFIPRTVENSQLNCTQAPVLVTAANRYQGLHNICRFIYNRHIKE